MRSKSGPGGTLYRYSLCELAQRQAVLVRKSKSPGRAIKSDRAKVVMTAGCISKNCGIINYTCREKEITRQIRILQKIPSEDLSTEGKSIAHRGRIMRIVYANCHMLHEYLLEDHLGWRLLQ